MTSQFLAFSRKQVLKPKVFSPDTIVADVNKLLRRLIGENIQLVNRVGELAETADHHPDITFGWGYAEIALTTHDRGGITDVDIALAKQIDGLDKRK